VGVYYPRLSQKWGYEVGVPVKNAAISDVFSQLYPWRKIAVDQIKSGTFPLWNPYSFSGTPLLANWQSAPFYPLNILLVILGNTWGWGLLISFQMLIASLGMYLFLRSLKLEKLSSFFGSVVFGYSGFMLIFLTYGTLGQAGAWIPWMMWSISSYFNNKKNMRISMFPIFIFLCVSAGSFQVALYGCGLCFAYFIWKLKNDINRKNSVYSFGVLTIIGLGLCAIYLLPVFEFLKLSIRNLDQNIEQYNFGLIPLRALVTFLAPDYFGNPTTGNFRGFIYHETTFYIGIVTLPFLAYGIWYKFKDKFFFGIVAIIALLMVFDTPIGRLVYEHNVPFLSTSYASRLNIIFQFCASVLAAGGVESILKTKRKLVFCSFWTLVGALAVFAYLSGMRYLGWNPLLWSDKYIVSWKNMLLPIGLSSGVLVASLIFHNKKRTLILACSFLLLADLFRFGWKYTPFTSKNIDFPVTGSIEFLQKNAGNFRIERERAELMPPNTWSYYGLSSPSGYDPLYSLDYSRLYKIYNLSNPKDDPTRYAEAERPDSPILDLMGVKYFLALRRTKGVPDEMGELPHLTKSDKYKEVFKDGPTSVLENMYVWPRTVVYHNWEVEPDLIDNLNKLRNGYDFKKSILLEKNIGIKPSGENPVVAEIIEYKSDEIIIRADGGKNGGVLFLSDTYYPGWNVYVNGKESTIIRAFGDLRAVEIGAGQSDVVFKYRPKSFFVGLAICLGSMILLIIFFFKKKVSSITMPGTGL